MKNITVNEIRPFVRYARKLSTDIKKFAHPICGYDNRLFYCTRGKGQMTIDGKVYDLKQGVLIYIKAGIPYSYLPDGKDPMRLLAFNFDLTFGAAYKTVPVPPEKVDTFNKEQILCDTNVRDVELLNGFSVFSDMGYLYEKLSEINSEYTSAKMFFEQRCSGLMLDVIAELLTTYEGDQSHKGTDTVDAVIDYLGRHYSEDVSNGNLGAKFGYHPNYLNQLFIRYTGKSLHKYLQDMRILKAVDLLQETSLPVSEVAISVGFKDLPHFSRYFKQKTGYSPTDFR